MKQWVKILFVASADDRADCISERAQLAQTMSSGEAFLCCFFNSTASLSIFRRISYADETDSLSLNLSFFLHRVRFVYIDCSIDDLVRRPTTSYYQY